MYLSNILISFLYGILLFKRSDGGFFIDLLGGSLQQLNRDYSDSYTRDKRGFEIGSPLSLLQSNSAARRFSQEDLNDQYNSFPPRPNQRSVGNPIIGHSQSIENRYNGIDGIMIL